MQKAKLALFSLITLAVLFAACRGTLPPTEPPRVSNEAAPGTRTNDGPILGPLAGDGIVTAAGTGSGGTGILPTPPAPGPAGSGSGGSAGRGIH